MNNNVCGVYIIINMVRVFTFSTYQHGIIYTLYLKINLKKPFN